MIKYRYDVINAIIKKYGYKSYLEIGKQLGINFKAVDCSLKLAVDPNPDYKANFVMESDLFFKVNKMKFDCIFIDGLHHAEQCERDIINSLAILNEGGTIICHDMSPVHEAHTRVPRVTKNWNGDVFKTWLKLRQSRVDLSMLVVDIDWGCGIIQRGSQQLLKVSEAIKFDSLMKNKKQWLNLFTVEEFEKWLSI